MIKNSTKVSYIAGFALLCSVPAHADAPAGRYTAGTGTVFDSKTGLTWEQPASTTALAWTDANSHCVAKGAGWRLPTVKELFSLVDFGKAMSPAPAMIDATFTGTQSAIYWSSTKVAGSPSSAWYVAFDDGRASNVDMSIVGYVRCVR